MSTKDITRFRTVADYSDFSSFNGCCCVPTDDPLGVDDEIASNYQECEYYGGMFFPEPCNFIECPNPKGTGCCCSCVTSNADQFFEDPTILTYPNNGLEDDISLCVCNEREGRWYSGRCEDIGVDYLCGAGDPYDPRWPNACCHYEDDTFQNLICTNTCDAKECSDIPHSFSYYDDGTVCDNYGLNGTPPADCLNTINVNRNFDSDYDVRGYGSPMGNCIYYKNNKQNCSLLNKLDCKIKKGFFLDTKYRKGNAGLNCGDYPATTTNLGPDKLGPYNITQEDADKFNIGDDFFGLGIWCGVFDLYSSKLKLPSKLTGIATDQDNPSSLLDLNLKQNRKFAILLDYNDFITQHYESNLPSSAIGYVNSYHNGQFNSRFTSGKLSEALSKYSKNNVKDYYIPSLYEWGYLQSNVFENIDFIENLKNNHMMESVSLPISYSYMTSTVKNGMVYNYSPSIKISSSESFDLNDKDAIYNYNYLKNNNKNDVYNNIRIMNTFYASIDKDDPKINDKYIRENKQNPFVYLNHFTYNSHIRLIKRLLVL